MKVKTLAYLSVITLVASLVPAAHAQTFSVIYSFKDGAFDGAYPTSGVTIKGNTLYGTTTEGGIGCDMGHGCGTVYQIKHVGSDWFETLIVRFADNANPLGRVVFGPDGHLYGTTPYADFAYGGLVYRLTPPLSICKTAACFWTVNNIHTFTGGSDGSEPSAGDLIWDQQGNLYGTTSSAGSLGGGTVFQMTGSGDSWTEAPIFGFNLPGGYAPESGVVMDSNGNLFGTTRLGGDHFQGTVYELTYSPLTGWRETTLYSFTGGDSDGGAPLAGVILDSSGNLYGATQQGPQGAVIFELSPSGNTWVFKVLYQFPLGLGGVYTNLTLDAAGNLYGTTYSGGAFGKGSVFKLTNTGNGWVYTSLHDFTGGPDGASPRSQITIDTDGTLYGTAGRGGSSDRGVVWMINP